MNLHRIELEQMRLLYMDHTSVYAPNQEPVTWRRFAEMGEAVLRARELETRNVDKASSDVRPAEENASGWATIKSNQKKFLNLSMVTYTYRFVPILCSVTIRPMRQAVAELDARAPCWPHRNS